MILYLAIVYHLFVNASINNRSREFIMYCVESTSIALFFFSLILIGIFCSIVTITSNNLSTVFECKVVISCKLYHPFLRAGRCHTKVDARGQQSRKLFLYTNNSLQVLSRQLIVHDCIINFLIKKRKRCLYPDSKVTRQSKWPRINGHNSLKIASNSRKFSRMTESFVVHSSCYHKNRNRMRKRPQNSNKMHQKYYFIGF